MLQELDPGGGGFREKSSVQPQSSETSRSQAFWRNAHNLPGGALLARQGRMAGCDKIAVLSGWACEFQLLPDGRRQVFDFLLPQEVVELPTSATGRRQLLAITPIVVVDCAAALQDLDEPVTRSWLASEHDRRVRSFDQVLRLGRLTAEERVLNLLVDFYHRLSRAGLVRTNSYRLPLTRELLADALGLSIVHLNRTVQALRRDGHITLDKGQLTLHQPHLLEHLACYNSQDENDTRDIAARARKSVFA